MGGHTIEAETPNVTLREVNVKNLEAILALKVAEPQQGFVAPNTKSIAQAHFFPEAWFRAVYNTEQPVGFLMLHDEHLRPEPREQGYYFLWRLMVDESSQGLGIGRLAVEALVAHVQTRPKATRLLTSCKQGPGSPEGFYLKLGFVPMGTSSEGELELQLSL